MFIGQFCSTNYRLKSINLFKDACGQEISNTYMTTVVNKPPS